MARARNIKPGFFRNEELVELPYETRLLFIGLWTIADREGRIDDRCKRIKMELFPADDLDVNACLDQLQAAGFILRYAVGEGRYIQVMAFTKHQNPHQKEQASTIPAPPLKGKPDTSIVQAPDKHRASTGLELDTYDADTGQAGLNPSSLNPDSLTPPRLGGVGGDDVPNQSKLDERFDRWWAAYPSKVGKGAAHKVWVRLKPDDALTGVMIDAVEAQKATLRWFRDDGRYIPNPATWLNQERWCDEMDATAAEQCNDTYIAAFGDDNVRRMAEWLDALNSTFGGVGWVRSALRKLAVEVPGLTPEQLKTGLTTGFGRAETSLKAEDARIANPPALVHAMFRDALREQREVAS